MSEELKPCPFCGGEAILKDLDNFEFYVLCTQCHVMTDEYTKCDFCELEYCNKECPSEALNKCKSTPIEVWNRRINHE